MATDATGNVSRQMAAAPRQTPPAAAPKADENRFAPHFVVLGFKAVATKDPLKWDDGTLSTRLAEVIIGVGQSGLRFTANINMLTRGEKKDIVCQLPSTGGKFRRPLFVVADNDPTATADLIRWRKSAVSEYLSWRKGNKLAASATVSSSDAETRLDSDMLKELGLE